MGIRDAPGGNEGNRTWTNHPVAASLVRQGVSSQPSGLPGRLGLRLYASGTWHGRRALRPSKTTSWARYSEDQSNPTPGSASFLQCMYVHSQQPSQVQRAKRLCMHFRDLPCMPDEAPERNRTGNSSCHPPSHVSQWWWTKGSPNDASHQSGRRPS